MQGLVFRPQWDQPGRRDVTYAFAPEADAFREHHRIEPDQVVVFDNRRGMLYRRDSCLAAIDSARQSARESLKLMAFFCHGWKGGIQAGFRSRDLPLLANRLRGWAVDDLVVVLYACDAARDADGQRRDDRRDVVGGNGGFADGLRNSLCMAGLVNCRVYGHTVVGHSTQSPWVRRFEGGGSHLGGRGGRYIVRPYSRLWPRWRKALRGDMRFRFPLMTFDEIHTELAGE